MFASQFAFKALWAVGTAAALCLGFGAALPATAQDGVFVVAGREHTGDREEVVRLAAGQTGQTVSGVTAQTHLPVAFSSFQTLIVPEKGPDRVESANPGGSQIFGVSVAVPGGTFTDLIANVYVENDPAPGATLTIGVSGSAGTTTASYPLAKGNNVFSIVADPGVTLQSVTFSGTVMQGVATTFTALRSVRISGAAANAAPAP